MSLNRACPDQSAPGFATEAVLAAAGDVRGTAEDWTCVDPAPVRDLLRWRPRRSLSDALSALWEHTVARWRVTAGEGCAIR